MDDASLNDLVRRLTALVVKIDERDTHMVERLDALQTMIEEQRGWNVEQRQINARLTAAVERLDTLMQRVFQPRPNGHED